MKRREIAARLVIAEYVRTDDIHDVKRWLTETTYQCWDDATIIGAALDECEAEDAKEVRNGRAK